MTADTHFDHAKLWSVWDHRKKGFEKEIVKAWNSVVSKYDKVLHLGDVSISNQGNTVFWTKQLNGRKYLIRGNHDNHTDGWYRTCGFETMPNAYKKFGQKDGSYIHVLFTHEPVVDLPKGWFNIHGHLHGDSHRGILTTKNHFDVGVDAVGYKPIPLYEILAKFKA